ncbi:YezD family protein [Aquisphaera insulae]|uniref:YezD family protein n=1 Tax=Aquisphaera insulae TaxID=2712864 RepID=UPI0013EB85A4|nr:YezD family protein [Aquisphaera insulae]
METRLLANGQGQKGPHPGRPADVDLERVRKALHGIRFGEVRVIVQDGVVVQIERIEKERLR